METKKKTTVQEDIGDVWEDANVEKRNDNIVGFTTNSNSDDIFEAVLHCHEPIKKQEQEKKVEDKKDVKKDVKKGAKKKFTKIYVEKDTDIF
jgi:hypothetical protein